MLLQNTLVPCWIAVAMAVGASETRAQSLSVAGTLSCTTSESGQAAQADAILSCRFQSPKGLDGDLTGKIARIGEADLPSGKRVLIWSVLAPSANIVLGDLEGQYSGETGGTTTGRLAGGKVKNIVLDPVNRTVQTGEAPVPTVLELELQAVRA